MHAVSTSRGTYSGVQSREWKTRLQERNRWPFVMARTTVLGGILCRGAHAMHLRQSRDSHQASTLQVSSPSQAYARTIVRPVNTR